MKAINRDQLFTAGCLSLLVTSLSFDISVGILNQGDAQFHPDTFQSKTI